MADWTDGAQYAPVARPYGFATPQAAPLAAGQADAGAAVDTLPGHAPAGYTEPGDVVQLDRLAPDAGPQREPHLPFADETASDSAWGAAHASRNWNPTMPLVEPDALQPPWASAAPADFPPPATFPPPVGQLPAGVAPGLAPSPAPAPDPRLSQLPPPVGPPVALPPPGAMAPTQQPSERVTLALAASQAGGVMLGVLAFGLVVGSLSYVMLAVASFLAVRSRAGQRAIRTGFNVCFALLLAGILLDLAQGNSFGGTATLGRLCCAAMIMVSLVGADSDLRRRNRR